MRAGSELMLQFYSSLYRDSIELSDEIIIHRTENGLSNMAKLILVACLCAVVVTVTAAPPSRGRNQQQRGGSSAVNSRVFNNRQYSNNKYYNNNFLKNYNPGVESSQARIIDQQQHANRDGVYSYRYETENGIQAEESGNSVYVSKDEQKKVVQGQYSFITPEGVRVNVKYTADEFGFHPIITYDGPNAEPLANQQRPADVVINRLA